MLRCEKKKIEDDLEYAIAAQYFSNLLSKKS